MLRKWSCLLLLWGALAHAAPRPADGGRVVHVGKGLQYASVAEAAASAKDGDTIEIEAGDYWRDVAVWRQRQLTIRGVHGPVRIMAGGAAAEGKGIWVFRGGDFLVENIAFHGAKVPDQNGAGIRFEGGRLVVRNCVFADNENGLLTSSAPESELKVENSEFLRNGYGDGQSHNIYVGRIGKFTFVGNYSHLANVGHLLKSRARENYVLYNRLTDEEGGRASYELEFPSGGIAYVIGNIVEQSSTTENPYVISFGTEGYSWPANELYLVNNTLVDDRAKDGRFFRLAPGAQLVWAFNNLLLGKDDIGPVGANSGLGGVMKAVRSIVMGKVEGAPGGEPFSYINNPHAEWGDVAMAPRYDYRLKMQSALLGKAVEPGRGRGYSLRPDKEFVSPRGTRPIPAGRRLNPGAVQTIAP